MKNLSLLWQKKTPWEQWELMNHGSKTASETAKQWAEKLRELRLSGGSSLWATSLTLPYCSHTVICYDKNIDYSRFQGLFTGLAAELICCSWWTNSLQLRSMGACWLKRVMNALLLSFYLLYTTLSHFPLPQGVWFQLDTALQVLKEQQQQQSAFS